MNDLDSPFLERAMEAIQEPFFVFTPEGRLLKWNRRLEEVTGYTSEEITEMSPTDLMPPQEEDQVKEEVARALENGSVQFEAHFQTKGGRRVRSAFTGTTYEQNGTTLICGTGRPIGETGADEIRGASTKQIQEVQQKNALLALTKEIASASNEAESFGEALQVAVDKVCEHTGWAVGHVYIPAHKGRAIQLSPSDEEATGDVAEGDAASRSQINVDTESSRTETSENVLRPTGLWNRGSRDRFERFREVTEQTSFALGEGLPGRVLKTGDPAWIEDVTKDTNFPRAQLAADIGVKGAFGFPVPLNDEVVAVLEFFSEEAETPDTELLEVMQSIGVQLGRVTERERARHRLESSVRQYRSLKDSTVDGIVLANSEGKIIDWNRGARKIFGYRQEEVLGRRIEILMPERHKEPHRKGMERVRETGTGPLLGKTVVLEGLRKSGEEFPLELSLSSWETQGERFFSAIIRDITERRQREKELRRSEKRYRRLFEDALEGILISTPEGKVLAANPAAEQILGYSREEFREIDAEQLYADPQERKELTDELREKAALRREEVRLRRADGQEIICELSVTVRDEEDTPTRWQGLFRDITERKKAEQALRESEEMFRTLSEKALVGVALLREDAYLYVNPAFAEIAGRPRKEIIGLPPDSVFHPDDRPAVRKQVTKRIEGTRQDAHYEARIQTKSGETRHVEILGVRIEYQGEPAIMGTVQDVTEQRRLQEEMLRIQENERRRLGQDLHDSLASQLTGANIKLGLLARTVDDELTENVQEIQRIIEESAGDVRRLSRGLNPAGLPEGDLSSALEGLASGIENARFEATLNGAAEAPSEESSLLSAEVATHLYRIAQEAVNNAQKYADASSIALRLTYEDDEVILQIEDDGTGFVPEEARKGLGLRSMQHRAKLLGADLTIESSRGEGTLVRCRLPL